MYVYIYMQLCVCIYVYIYICFHIYIYIYMYRCILISIHIYIYIYKRASTPPRPMPPHLPRRAAPRHAVNPKTAASTAGGPDTGCDRQFLQVQCRQMDPHSGASDFLQAFLKRRKAMILGSETCFEIYDFVMYYIYTHDNILCIHTYIRTYIYIYIYIYT